MNENTHYDHIEKAIRNNDLILVKQFIDDSFDIHYDDDFFLRLSSWFGFLDITKLLVEYGADMTAKNSDPISYSAQNGHIDTVKFFIEQGISPESGDGRSLLYACNKGHYNIVKLILDSGMNADYISPSGNRQYKALSGAAASNSLDIMELLLQHGADIHYDNENALKSAIHYSRAEAVEFLLQHGAATNLIEESKIIYCGTPIHDWYSESQKKEYIIANSHKWNIFNSFIKYGFKFNLNEELLINLIHEKNINKIDTVIHHGMNIFMNRGIALQISAINDYDDVSSYLLSMGLEPDSCDIYSNPDISKSSALFIKNTYEKIKLENHLNTSMTQKEILHKNKI